MVSIANTFCELCLYPYQLIINAPFRKMGVDTQTWRCRIGRFSGKKKRRKDARDERINYYIFNIFAPAVPSIYQTIQNFVQSPEFLLKFCVLDPSKSLFQNDKPVVQVPKHCMGVSVYEGQLKVSPQVIAVIEFLLIIGDVEVIL